MDFARALGRGVVAASCVLVAACGPTTVDTSSVEQDVTASIHDPGSVQVDTVDCPHDQAPEVGATFMCSYVLTAGSAGEVTVTVRDEDGALTWEVTKPASGQAEQVILTGYQKEIGRTAKSVDCPDPLKDGEKAKTICTVKFPNGETREVTVRVNGGDIRWSTR
jgi:hypothetical protein